MESFVQMKTVSAGSPREAALDEYAGLVRSLHFGGGGRELPWTGLDLTLPQLKVIWLLACRAGGMHGRELAAVLGVGPPAVTALVERIVEHGYAQREEDPHDRRISRIRLTERGRALAERMTAGQRERLGEILDRLSADELDSVVRALRLLRQAGEQTSVARGPAEPAQA